MRKSRITSVVGALLLAAGTTAIATPAFATAQNDYGHHTDVLAWSRYDDAVSGTARIVVTDARAHRITPITHPPTGAQDIDPRISPDGRWILFERDLPTPESEAFIIGTDGRGEHRLDLRCTAPCAGTNDPSWTPDGHHVIYDRVSGPFDSNGNAASAVLWVSTLDGAHQVRVSAPGIEPTFEETDATFAPAGYRVVLRFGNGHSAVFREWLDGSHAVQLTPWGLDADLPFVSPARYGPSRDHVVFETYGSGAPDGSTVGQRVATVPTTCTSLGDCTAKIRYLTPPTPLPVMYFNPSWSPDGHRVIFVRFDHDAVKHLASGDIWTMNWNGTNPQPLSQDPRFEYRPVWGSRN